MAKMKPRERIASHLRRILVAAGMTLPQPGHADTTTPKQPPNKGNEGKKTPKPPKKRESLGYEVVDMMPEPFVERAPEGTLELRSTPSGATVLIDGKLQSQKTPLSMKLPIGLHAVTMRHGKVTKNFTVDVTIDKTALESRDLSPSPSPEPKK
jgi:hypothetical protein